MTSHISERARWASVVAFAIAMAWVEAASVLYIRLLVDRIEPYQADPLPMQGALSETQWATDDMWFVDYDYDAAAGVPVYTDVTLELVWEQKLVAI